MPEQTPAPDAPAPQGAPSIGTPAGEQFMSRAFSAVPNWAAGTIGTLCGFGLALSLFLLTSGLSAPVQRVVDAWAKRIETQATRVSDSSERLEIAINKLNAASEATATALASINERLATDKVALAALQTDVGTLRVEVSGIRDRQAGMITVIDEIKRRPGFINVSATEPKRAPEQPPADRPRPAAMPPKKADPPPASKPWWVLN